jgi:hypothetical protein
MSDYVTDTHALFWYLADDSRLGDEANRAFEEAEQGHALIYVPAIVLAEMYYLMAKQGLLPRFPALVPGNCGGAIHACRALSGGGCFGLRPALGYSGDA